MACGQFLECRQTRICGPPSLRSRHRCHWIISRGRTPLVPSRSSSQSFLWLLVLLSSATNRLEFSRHQSPPRCHRQPSARLSHRRRALCSTPLAESSPRATHFDWRSFNVLGVREGAQHSFAYRVANDSWHARLVGFPDRLASQHARRTRLLSFPFALRAGLQIQVGIISASFHASQTLPSCLVRPNTRNRKFALRAGPILNTVLQHIVPRPPHQQLLALRAIRVRAIAINVSFVHVAQPHLHRNLPCAI